MHNSSAKRDLGPQFEASVLNASSKMAYSASHNQGTPATRSGDPKPIIVPASLTFTPAAQGEALHSVTPSPASTESLINRTQGDWGLLSPDIGSDDKVPVTPISAAYAQPSHTEELLQRFSDLLEKGLAATALKITNDIRQDLQSFGERVDVVEQKIDHTVQVTNQNTALINSLQTQLETATLRIDDLENRSRRYNFRVRGIPESMTNVPQAMQSLIKFLLPDIPQQRMELDRAHRSLGPLRKDGLPRDIIVKPHYYETKEAVMQKSKQMKQIRFQGHKIQIFADLSQATLQKRRSLKTLLVALSGKNIVYKWAFPLAVRFSYEGHNHSFSSFVQGEQLLLRLNLISQESNMDTSTLQPTSSKRPPPASPLQPIWTKVKSKRSKDANPT